MIPIREFAYRFIMRRWNSKLERNVAQQIARCMERRRRAAAETINQRPPAPRISLCLRFPPLPFCKAHANRTRLNGERCNGPRKERSIEELSATFRTFLFIRFECANPYESFGEGRTDVLNCVQTNHFGTIDVRKHSCVMLRR